MLNEKIKTIRKNKGFTQEELASQLHVTRQTISKWEKGLSVPDADMLSRIAEVFDVSITELLGMEKVEWQQMDAITEQLCRINEQLAIKNRRAKRVWKTVVILIIVLVGIPAVITIAGATAFIFNAPTVSETSPDVAGVVKWEGALNGEVYTYEIEYDDEYRILTYSGDLMGYEAEELLKTELPDFSSYGDANKLAEDIEKFYEENNGYLTYEVKQLIPEIYKAEFE